MQFLTLTEHKSSKPIRLTNPAVALLQSPPLSIDLKPFPGKGYVLTPGATVGAVVVEDLAINIQPKFPITNLLFLLSFALNPNAWKDIGFEFNEEDAIVEAIIPGFVHQVRRAFTGGVLYGYIGREEALNVLRGRIRINEQIRRRFGRMPPVEVAYDEYTPDIELNQLIKAALTRLRSLRIRGGTVQSSLHSFDVALTEVSSVDYRGLPLPEVAFNRLNAHYEPAVRLAKLILRATSLEAEHGQVRSSSFLVNMNDVFEDFVVVALREALSLSQHSFPQGAKDKTLTLDKGQKINLEPDVSWWEGGNCVFVGDAKYKKTKAGGIVHPDLYQLLSYSVASSLPAGLLVYAKGEDQEAVHHTIHAGKELWVRTLDLTESPDAILRQINVIAGVIRNMKVRPPAHRAPAAIAV